MSNTTGNSMSYFIKKTMNTVKNTNSKFNLISVLDSLIHVSNNYNDMLSRSMLIEHVPPDEGERRMIGLHFLESAVLQKQADGQPITDENIATQDDKDKIIELLRKCEECVSESKTIPVEFFLELYIFGLKAVVKIKEDRIKEREDRIEELKAEAEALKLEAEALNNASGVNFDNLKDDEKKGKPTKHKIYAEDSDSEDSDSEDLESKHSDKHSGGKKPRMKGLNRGR